VCVCVCVCVCSGAECTIRLPQPGFLNQACSTAQAQALGSSPDREQVSGTGDGSTRDEATRAPLAHSSRRRRSLLILDLSNDAQLTRMRESRGVDEADDSVVLL